VLVVPLLLTQNGADASASVQPVHAPSTRITTDRMVTSHARDRHAPRRVAGAGPAPVVIAEAPVRQMVPDTAAAVIAAPSVTTIPPTTTTTTTTTVPPARVAVSSVQNRGDVTYYDHPAGRCASPWLPFGTVVTVTNPANGATVSCVVDDREADTDRSIDLATSTFALIAPLSQGVVHAILHW